MRGRRPPLLIFGEDMAGAGAPPPIDNGGVGGVVVRAWKQRGKRAREREIGPERARMRRRHHTSGGAGNLKEKGRVLELKFRFKGLTGGVKRRGGEEMAPAAGDFKGGRPREGRKSGRDGSERIENLF